MRRAVRAYASQPSTQDSRAWKQSSQQFKLTRMMMHLGWVPLRYSTLIMLVSLFSSSVLTDCDSPDTFTFTDRFGADTKLKFVELLSSLLIHIRATSSKNQGNHSPLLVLILPLSLQEFSTLYSFSVVLFPLFIFHFLISNKHNLIMSIQNASLLHSSQPFASVSESPLALTPFLRPTR